MSYPRPDDVRKIVDEHQRQGPDLPDSRPPSPREMRRMRRQQEAELQRLRREAFARGVRTHRREIVDGIDRAAKDGRTQVTVEIESPAVGKHLRDELARTGYNVRLEKVPNKVAGDPQTYRVRVAW